MTGPTGLLSLSDPPTEFKGFIDGQRVWANGIEYIYHKANGREFARLEPVEKDLVHDPGPKSR